MVQAVSGPQTLILGGRILDAAPQTASNSIFRFAILRRSELYGR